MDMIPSLTSAVTMMLNWQVPFWILLGLVIGVFLGAMPGVSGVLAITLLLGPSYYMDPLMAIIFLTAIYTGSVYGGGISAILLNIPGTPAAIATGFDGYPMSRQGRHNEALGASLISSGVGCCVGYLVVLLLFLPIGQLVLRFGPAEMLMVVAFAIVSIGAVKGELVRTATVGLFGILLGTVGSSAFGSPRGIFGHDSLYEGIPLIPALLGILAVSELFIMMERQYVIDDGAKPRQKIGEIFKGMRQALRHPKSLVRSSLIGVGIGLMPAAGSTIAAMISYGADKRWSAHPERYGKGEIRGIIAAEAANNGSEGGAVATMMLLGIPGSVTTALLIAAFMIHGMSPGPFLVRDNLDFAYAVILSQIFQAMGLVVVAALFVNYFGRLIHLPTRVLVPSILIFAVVGALAPRALIIDPVIMLLFAGLGLVMKKLNYPIIGFVLGFILGGVVDREFVRSYLLYGDDLAGVLQRPAFVVLMLLTVGSALWPWLTRCVQAGRCHLKR